MTEKEFYEKIGGDYGEASSRLVKDSLIRKFVLKFKTDPNYMGLCDAIGSGDFDKAFEFSHTLKGVALNLAFKRLSAATVILTDALRPERRSSLDPAAAVQMLDAVSDEYKLVISSLDEIEN